MDVSTPFLTGGAAMTSAGPTARPSVAAEAAREAAADPKLARAAHQFEASLIAELVKPLTSGGGLSEDDNTPQGGSLAALSSSGEGSGGALMSFGAEALAKAISDHGGLGIARQILAHFDEAAGRRDDGRGRENAGNERNPGNEAASPAVNRSSITKVI